MKKQIETILRYWMGADFEKDLQNKVNAIMEVF